MAKPLCRKTRTTKKKEQALAAMRSAEKTCAARPSFRWKRPSERRPWTRRIGKTHAAGKARSPPKMGPEAGGRSVQVTKKLSIEKYVAKHAGIITCAEGMSINVINFSLITG